MINKRKDYEPDFHFMATGIGSVPSTDIQGTCTRILNNLPQIPFWPQFVRRSHLEDMVIQFSEGLPHLKVIEEKRGLVAISDDMEAELVNFYEHFLAEERNYFAVGKEYAPGLYRLLDLVSQNPSAFGPYIKGQTVGPVTFMAGILDPAGRSVLHNPDLREAMVNGLSIKTAWQADKLGETGKNPVIFLDEPYLTGFGSAFSPIQRDEVIMIIKEVIDYVKERSGALIGIHCCGNTDWSMLMETGPDIINFDVYSYMDYFFLYREEIIRFLRGGGSIAWGIVPTIDFSGEETEEDLHSKLHEGLNRLFEWGLDQKTVYGSSILTPACGMGTMEQDSSNRVLDLLSKLSQRCAELDLG